MTFSQLPSVTYPIICLKNLSVRNRFFFFSNLIPQMPISPTLVYSQEKKQLATSKCSSFTHPLDHVSSPSGYQKFFIIYVSKNKMNFQLQVYHQLIFCFLGHLLLASVSSPRMVSVLILSLSWNKELLHFLFF